MTDNPSYLIHHGILGQKWGVRRYQNPDGTLTEEGKKKYGTDVKKAKEAILKDQKKKDIAIGVGVGVGLAAYEAYNLSKFLKSVTKTPVGQYDNIGKWAKDQVHQFTHKDECYSEIPNDVWEKMSKNAKKVERMMLEDNPDTFDADWRYAD